MIDQRESFRLLSQRIRAQVRVAANTTVTILTTLHGQLLTFDAAGPFAGTHLWLDRPFAFSIATASVSSSSTNMVGFVCIC
jgi:hypothetical protein